MTQRSAQQSVPAQVPVARCEGISKTYGTGETAVRALDDVSLDVPRGRFLAIMGPSGSGKSTLMHCLAGLDTVDQGKIYIGDAELTAMGERQLTELRRDRIGFIFQSFNLVPMLTALENITLPLAIAGRRPDKAWLDHVIDIVGLGPRLHHRPSELSGGQQQRVAAARALAGKPEVVFADEPTGNLDSRSGAEVLIFLKESVRSTDQTVVMVTHDPAAAGFTDSVLFLADGRIVEHMTDPTAAKVLERMKGFEVRPVDRTVAPESEQVR